MRGPRRAGPGRAAGDAEAPPERAPPSPSTRGVCGRGPGRAGRGGAGGPLARQVRGPSRGFALASPLLPGVPGALPRHVGVCHGRAPGAGRGGARCAALRLCAAGAGRCGAGPAVASLRVGARGCPGGGGPAGGGRRSRSRTEAQTRGAGSVCTSPGAALAAACSPARALSFHLAVVSPTQGCGYVRSAPLFWLEGDSVCYCGFF